MINTQTHNHQCYNGFWNRLSKSAWNAENWKLLKIRMKRGRHENDQIYFRIFFFFFFFSVFFFLSLFYIFFLLMGFRWAYHEPIIKSQVMKIRIRVMMINLYAKFFHESYTRYQWLAFISFLFQLEWHTKKKSMKINLQFVRERNTLKTKNRLLNLKTKSIVHCKQNWRVKVHDHRIYIKRIALAQHHCNNKRLKSDLCEKKKKCKKIIHWSDLKYLNFFL